jgi:hypothetical protein
MSHPFINFTQNQITMKGIKLLLALFISYSASAQDLPKKSAKSEIEQMVGLTEIEIEYSRPNANNRVIFGELVPYGEVWRLGANEPTTISIDFPIEINGQVLDTGKYAVFAIPEKNYWKMVFNTDTEQWGAGNYDPKKNVIEYNAAATSSSFNESFTISFDNVNEYGAVLSFQWATTKVNVPFTTNTDKAVEISINKAIEKGEKLEKVYYKAADYAIDRNDFEEARKLINKSLEIERSYYNVFLLAQIEKETDVKTARKLGAEAAELAVKADKQRWADYINRTIDEW